jgi:hypothetical protein
VEGALSASFSGTDGEIPPGNTAGVTIRAYLPKRVFALTDVGVEKIVDDNPLGDAIVKNSDWYLSTGSAYLSLRTEPVDLAAGLIRNRWGPGSSGTLLLSDAALSYPALFFAKTFGERGRFTALTAALHYPENRWFSAHRVEFRVGSRLRIGVHESVAYGATAAPGAGQVEEASGGVNPLYAIGLIPYTLVQRILDRTAEGGVRPHRNNIMMGGDFVWRIGGGLRVDGELLVDDLATETSTQPHRLAFQAGCSYSGELFGSSADLRAEIVKVYRYTYAVFYGANFLLDGVPLGYGIGPDVERYELSFERDLSTDLEAGLGIDLTRKGESEAGEFWDPDDPQSQNAAATLSGTVETTLFPHLRARGTWRDVVWVQARLGPVHVENAEHRARDVNEIRGEVDARIQW